MDTTTYYVIRREEKARTVIPALRYWSGATQSWGDYETATRYDHQPRMILQALEEPTHAFTVTEAYREDIDGFPYTVDQHIGPVRMTHCCGAATSVSDGPLYCKSCYEAVDWAYDGPARLADTDPDGPRGPITITLPPMEAQR